MQKFIKKSYKLSLFVLLLAIANFGFISNVQAEARSFTLYFSVPNLKEGHFTNLSLTPPVSMTNGGHSFRVTIPDTSKPATITYRLIPIGYDPPGEESFIITINDRPDNTCSVSKMKNWSGSCKKVDNRPDTDYSIAISH